jgi:putative phosphoesterase
MRFAAIADIHGNALALEAVLADIAQLGIEHVVNLGDHLSGPLEAARTADILMARNFPSIAGNHDRQLIDRPSSEMGNWERLADAELSAHHRHWLRSLPATLMYRDEVFLCHGTPDSDTTYWLEAVSPDGAFHLAPYQQIEGHARGIEASLMLCGHTHTARAVRLTDGRMIVNPGSVGCPAYTDTKPVSHVVQSGTPDAYYAVLERGLSGWVASLRTVPYDHAGAADLARAHGAPKWAQALATGWLR